MKKILVFLCAFTLVFGVVGWAHASLINPVSASGTGTYNNDAGLLVDGYIPAEGTWWSTTPNVWWNGTEPIFTIDLGGLFNVEDMIVSVDNNDEYKVEYSVNNSDWSLLFTIDEDDGDVPVSPGGMDTMATIFGDTEYVWQIDFPTPVEAHYLRIYATGGDNMYAAGELQAYGIPIPEPATMLLLGGGLIGMAAFGRKKFFKK